MRALSGRPSVRSRTCTRATPYSNGYVRKAPPWILSAAASHSTDGESTTSGTTVAVKGNSASPRLRMATVFGWRGVATTALNGL